MAFLSLSSVYYSLFTKNFTAPRYLLLTGTTVGVQRPERSKGCRAQIDFGGSGILPGRGIETTATSVPKRRNYCFSHFCASMLLLVTVSLWFVWQLWLPKDGGTTNFGDQVAHPRLPSSFSGTSVSRPDLVKCRLLGTPALLALRSLGPLTVIASRPIG